jgi:predicted nucleic acid-binding Zn ribbon protein
MKKTEKIEIKEYFDDIYLEKNGVIADRFCPACKKVVDEDKQFCECGVLVNQKHKSYGWTALVILFLVLLSLTTYLSFDKKINIFSIISPDNLQISSLSPLNIQLISSLNDTPYKKYVQNIYVKDEDKNSIFILIRPSLWHILNENDKKKILELVQAKGELIYKEKYPDSVEKISINYANAK